MLAEKRYDSGDDEIESVSPVYMSDDGRNGGVIIECGSLITNNTLRPRRLISSNERRAEVKVEVEEEEQ